MIFPLIFLMKYLDASPQTRFHFSDILFSDVLFALTFPPSLILTEWSTLRFPTNSHIEALSSSLAVMQCHAWEIVEELTILGTVLYNLQMLGEPDQCSLLKSTKP